MRLGHWLGQRDTQLSNAGLDGADGKPFRFYPRCCPTRLDFFPRNHGLWPYALTANREDHMCGLRVPVCDAEHCEGGSKAVACYSCSLDIRYFGSGWDPRSWRILPGSQHIGYNLQCGLVSLPMSLNCTTDENLARGTNPFAR